MVRKARGKMILFNLKLTYFKLEFDSCVFNEKVRLNKLFSNDVP